MEGCESRGCRRPCPPAKVQGDTSPDKGWPSPPLAWPLTPCPKHLLTAQHWWVSPTRYFQ